MFCVNKIDFFVIFICVLLFCTTVSGQTIFVDSRNGDDNNSGTKSKPIKTLKHAVNFINNSTSNEGTSIKILPGIYNLSESLKINSSDRFSRNNRLKIEAEILPDDPEWKPALMPVILSTAEPEEKSTQGNPSEIPGFLVETSHVTFQGIRFLGNPSMEIWYYPIGRLDKTLDDLVVTQCLFTMDTYSHTCNVAVLAHGHGLVIDHCVFYNCRNSVVFWNAEGGVSKRNVMRYCIVDGGFTSGIWLCQTGEDFEFHNNIISRSNYAIMRDANNKANYKIKDSIITDYTHYSGKCGANWKLDPTGKEIIYHETGVTKKGKIELVKGVGIDINDVPKEFLHLAPGTLGSDLDAGLFMKNSSSENK